MEHARHKRKHIGEHNRAKKANAETAKRNQTYVFFTHKGV